MRSLPTARSCPFSPPDGAADEPIGKVRVQTDDEAWYVAKYDLARQMLAETRFSSEVNGGFAGTPLHKSDAPPGMFIQMDAPRHTRIRRLLTGRFTLQRMNRLRPRIEQIVADQLDHLEKQPRPVDLVEHFALPVPSLVICELLGVPYSDRKHFQEYSAKFLHADTTRAELEQADAEIGAYLFGLIAAKRAQPGDGLLDDLLDTDLSDEELAGAAVLLLIAGHETTANMLGLGTLLLLERPDQLALVRDDPEVVKTAVDEMLRYLSVVDTGLFRRASEDITLGDVTIPEGDFAVVTIAAANRDPVLCEDPDTFDVTRPRTHHLAFGFGPHQCLGQNLARLEMEIAYPALLNRLPGLRLAVPMEEVPTRDDMFIYGVYRMEVTW
ncbi:cytochrome P450 [Nonomuraea typhae]|uniref:cytochrome P450 n=1 Tax=Nonomuraea typhae TaxID=2603600 RepID=UPI0012FB645E|nr:cytochrome P450 [Nonomuraea typhae]